MFRPARRAAAVAAAIRIKDVVVRNSADSESSLHPDSLINNARQNGYDDSYFVIRYLLNECENAQFEDQRTDIAEKLFNYLIANPTILIYQPMFRISVISKMKQLEKHINDRVQVFQKNSYFDAVNMMKLSLRCNVRHSLMCSQLCENLDSITSTLKKYQKWADGKGLKKSFNKMYNLLDTIKNNPNYVSEASLIQH
jgi:hypothetical protein